MRSGPGLATDPARDPHPAPTRVRRIPSATHLLSTGRFLARQLSLRRCLAGVSCLIHYFGKFSAKLKSDAFPKCEVCCGKRPGTQKPESSRTRRQKLPFRGPRHPADVFCGSAAQSHRRRASRTSDIAGPRCERSSCRNGNVGPLAAFRRPWRVRSLSRPDRNTLPCGSALIGPEESNRWERCALLSDPFLGPATGFSLGRGDTPQRVALSFRGMAIATCHAAGWTSRP